MINAGINASINRLNTFSRAGNLQSQASFVLPFQDLGAGEVSTIAERSGATPTFTRATAATTIGPTGLVTAVATGVPRSYYDPTSLAYLGYLAEGARTNLVLNSLIDGTDFSTQAVNVTAVAHTLSFYGTGTLTLTGASTAGPLVGTGAYPQRVQLTFTPSAAALTLTVAGSCKYVQLEVGEFASSFIPTAGAAVTRNADVLTYPTSPWYNASEGTLFGQFRRDSLAVNGSVAQLYADVSNRAATNILTTGVFSIDINMGGSSSGQSSANSYIAGTTGKTAVGLKAADYPGSLNGGSVVNALAPATLTAGLTTLSVGVRGATSDLHLFGPIRRVAYFPSRLPNAALVALTT